MIMNTKEKRESLTRQVKVIYAELADRESRESFVQSTAASSPEAYYEKLLNCVLNDIEAGEFDHCATGREIVDTVANSK